MASNNEHFIYAMQLVSSSSFTMVLHTVIKLKILDTIAEAGPGAQLSAYEIVSRLSIPNEDAPGMVDRMLHLLSSYSIVTCTKGLHESRPIRVYGLTPVATYFIPNEDGVCLGSLLELGQDKVYTECWTGLKDSVVEGGIIFEKIHGAKPFEYLAADARFSKVFNKAMMDHSTIVMNKILECYDGFDNLESVADIGGGVGMTINMIVRKHPNVKGINYDLPHVTQSAPLYPGIQHIGGDMLEEVPHADAMFMKWILHDWSDDHCVKLLKNCFKALPVDGKVIVVESILPFGSDTSLSAKATTQMDVIMMAHFDGGKERTEDEFLRLAKAAGFEGIRKKCLICSYWVMEFYK